MSVSPLVMWSGGRIWSSFRKSGDCGGAGEVVALKLCLHGSRPLVLLALVVVAAAAGGSAQLGLRFGPGEPTLPLSAWEQRECLIGLPRESRLPEFSAGWESDIRRSTRPDQHAQSLRE